MFLYVKHNCTIVHYFMILTKICISLKNLTFLVPINGDLFFQFKIWG